MTQAGQGNMLRSVGAVLAGLLVIVVLSIGTDTVLRAAGVFPAVEFSRPADPRLSDLFYLLAMIYRTVYAVLGSYIAARRAPNHPMRHALVLGLVGVAFGTAGAIKARNLGPAFPLWYPVVLILVSLPCAWVGGKLVADRTRA
jgi:surface polysaccharide O-acyltransferase-like enzyme